LIPLRSFVRCSVTFVCSRCYVVPLILTFLVCRCVCSCGLVDLLICCSFVGFVVVTFVQFTLFGSVVGFCWVTLFGFVRVCGRSLFVIALLPLLYVLRYVCCVRCTVFVRSLSPRCYVVRSICYVVDPTLFDLFRSDGPFVVVVYCYV
jgi:hypothetical protein